MCVFVCIVCVHMYGVLLYVCVCMCLCVLVCVNCVICITLCKHLFMSL